MARDAIIVRDSLDRVVFWNPAAHSLYGWSRREALGVNAHDLLQTRFPMEKEAVLAALRRDGHWDGLLHQRTRDRGEIVTWSRWSALRDREGRIVSVIEANRDVTDQQGELAELRAIADSTMDAIISVDDELRVVLFNPAAERMMDVSTADAIGQPLDRFIPARYIDSHVRPTRDVCADGAEARTVEQPVEMAARRGDASDFPIEATISHVRAAGRSFCTVILRDVTERRMLEEQLRQAQKMDAIGRLAGGIAHDFNNLLSAITGYLEFVRPAVSDAVALADLGEIKHAADRAAQLTRQLLIFSRSEAARPRVVQPNDVVSGVDKLLRRVIGEHVRLEAVLAPDVPRVRVDPAQLEQALLNLAINARDAMPSGGTLTITTCRETMRGEHGVRDAAAIEVSDTGIGMDENTRARAIEPFFTTKDAGRGTGLGLAAVYGVVTRADGTVVIESEEGVGTRVLITLPAATDPEQDEHPPAIQSEGARGDGKRVLLVEDDDSVRTLARRLLQQRGHSVIEARTGDDALARWNDAAARRDVIDAVITDVVMPDMGGRELVSRLRRVRPRLPIVYMSGYLADAVSGLDLSEPSRLIEKPFTAASLNEAVDAVLELASASRSA